MRYISLDTETTGLSIESGHKLIEIGCLEIVDRSLTGRKFHQYLNPDREIDASATKIHGMTLNDLKENPSFEEISDRFCKFISGSTLLIHNSKFDLGFLNTELSKCGKPKIENFVEEVIDTLSLARALHPGKKNSLDMLCSRYKIDNSERVFHGALLDSFLLANVYLAMTRGQEDLNIQDVGDKDLRKVKQGTKMAQVIISVASDKDKDLHKNYLDRMEKDCKGKVLWRS